jgi:hypothetical protein
VPPRCEPIRGQGREEREAQGCLGTLGHLHLSSIPVEQADLSFL